MQNGFIESFDSSLRSELLNETRSPRQPRRVATPATLDFNTAQPHSQTAWQTPDEFASTFTPQQSLALHYAKGSGPALVASPAQQGTTNAGNEL